MATRIQYRQGSRTFTDLAKATIEETRQNIIAVAQREHSAVLRTDPRPGSWRQFVDGVEGAAFSAVRGNGVIVIDYSRLEIVVAYAMDTLIELSPVGRTDDDDEHPGLYRDSHTIFVDGQGARNLKGYDGASEIVITNPVPYSRKIERGVMKMRVPGSDHVYQQAEIIVSRQYGGVADVRFSYRAIVGGGIQDYGAIALGGRRGGKKATTAARAAFNAHQDNRFPALVIRPGRTRNLDAAYSRLARRA